MALSKTYLTISDDNVYDVAIKLFGDVTKIESLLAQFPDLNSAIPFNSEVEYIPTVPTVVNSTPLTTLQEPVYGFLTRQYQTVYDLAVQLYGDVSKIGNLLKLFPNLNNTIDLNSPISVGKQLDPIAIFFLDSGIIVATDIVIEGAGEDNIRITNLGIRVISTGEFRKVA